MVGKFFLLEKRILIISAYKDTRIFVLSKKGGETNLICWGYLERQEREMGFQRLDRGRMVRGCSMT